MADFLTKHNIIGGLLCVMIGITAIWYTYKYPTNNKALLPNTSGYMAGVGLIVLGVLLFIGYFN